MVCQTVKLGTECIFMKKNGCSYNGGRCYPIVESCKGCDRVVEYATGSYCKTYSETVHQVGKRILQFRHARQEGSQRRYLQIKSFKGFKAKHGPEGYSSILLVSSEESEPFSQRGFCLRRAGEGLYCSSVQQGKVQQEDS